jgi:hypothetical protein
VSRALAVLLLVLGLAVIVRTLIEGVGGGLGLLIGGVLLFAGALRLYVSRLK